MQPSSKEVVLLQEKKEKKKTLISIHKRFLYPQELRKKKYIQGRKAEQFFYFYNKEFAHILFLLVDPFNFLSQAHIGEAL